MSLVSAQRAAAAAADERGDDSSDGADKSSRAGSAGISEFIAFHLIVESALLLLHIRLHSTAAAAPFPLCGCSFCFCCLSHRWMRRRAADPTHTSSSLYLCVHSAARAECLPPAIPVAVCRSATLTQTANRTQDAQNTNKQQHAKRDTRHTETIAADSAHAEAYSCVAFAS